MIRNFLYSLTVFTAFAFFTSCEDTNGDNFHSNNEAGWVQFEDNTQVDFIGGYHTIIEVPVDLHTNVNNSGLDVYYTLENISGDISSVIVNDPGFIRFEKGQTTSHTKILIMSEIPVTGFLFNLNLLSTSRNNVDVLENVNSVFVTKTICVKPISIVTNYEGEVYFLETDENSEPEYISDISTSLTPTSTENVYSFGNGAWGSLYLPALTGNPTSGTNNYPAELVVNADGTVLVNGVAAYTTEGNEGSINICAGEITYILSQGLFTNPFLTKVVIRPVN